VRSDLSATSAINSFLFIFLLPSCYDLCKGEVNRSPRQLAYKPRCESSTEKNKCKQQFLCEVQKNILEGGSHPQSFLTKNMWNCEKTGAKN
jgi:hypothetical protein